MATSNPSEVFVENLLEWHETNGRYDLPWRADDTTPFNMLVAEFILQQTSAGQVLNVYGDFSPHRIVQHARQLADLLSSVDRHHNKKTMTESSRTANQPISNGVTSRDAELTTQRATLGGNNADL